MSLKSCRIALPLNFGIQINKKNLTITESVVNFNLLNFGYFVFKKETSFWEIEK